MDFVAIDVETANASRASICQIGVAAYSADAFVDGWVTYVNPQEYFDPMNVRIHGITPDAVAEAPTIKGIAEPLLLRLDNRVVVSNTNFDRVSVHQALVKHEQRLPSCLWLDSAQVARRTWDKSVTGGYGLHNLCCHIGYEFGHHDALEDAKAAGQVMLAAMEVSGLTLDDWLRRVGQPVGSSAPIGLTRLAREGNPEGSLSGEVIVFTGRLQLPRREAARMAAGLGCDVADSPTRNTTILVVGDQDVAKLVGHEKSSKHRKAETLIEQGAAIRILAESDFMQLVALE